MQYIIWAMTWFSSASLQLSIAFGKRFVLPVTRHPSPVTKRQ